MLQDDLSSAELGSASASLKCLELIKMCGLVSLFAVYVYSDGRAVAETDSGYHQRMEDTDTAKPRAR